jgi:RNA polymerase sigma-70 factor (ECF subfamily)
MARFRGEAEFATWLYRVTRNVLIDHLRTRRRQREVVETALGTAAYEAALQSAAPSAATPHEIETLRTALCQLTPRQRHLIEWKYGDGLTYAEISSRLCISEAAASQALYRAREALRKALRVDAGDHPVSRTGTARERRERNPSTGIPRERVRSGGTDPSNQR